MAPVIAASACEDKIKAFMKYFEIPIAEQCMGQKIYSIGQTTRLSCLVKPKSLSKTIGFTKMNLRNTRERNS